MSGEEGHQFGGDWTEEKLKRLSDYMDAYFKVMLNQSFELLYVDCFAGTGYRTPRDTEAHQSENLMSEALKDGSARIALKKNPGFDRFFFVEKDHARYEALSSIRNDFPDKRIDIAKGDANEFVREFCRRNWHDTRAVMFLDPYGMQVEWATLEAIAKTRAIDLWLLIPIGIGPNRLLVRDGQINPSWEEKLTRFLGCSKEEWFPALYPETGQLALFDEEPERKKLNLEGIAKYILGRLKTTFPNVAGNPQPIGPPNNPQMFYLFFAAANPKGGKIAIKIADHLLRN